MHLTAQLIEDALEHNKGVGKERMRSVTQDTLQQTQGSNSRGARGGDHTPGPGRRPHWERAQEESGFQQQGFRGDT